MNNLFKQAEHLDASDSLWHIKQQFSLPKDIVYLDGNSLGPLPLSAKKRALEVVEQQWGEDLISSWNKHQWIDLPKIIGNKIAPLIGAQADTVICCDSISVNLFKLLSAAMQMNKAASEVAANANLTPATDTTKGSGRRNKVLSQKDNFPTDLYMVQGLGALVGEQNCELLSVDAHDIVSTIEKHGLDISVLLLTQVNFRNGDIHDIQAITELAHTYGILVIWDLAHSAGVLPLNLAEWKVDFAVGCTYKYLNGGPGAPGFAYVAPKHLAHLQQPLSGWMGHKKPFEFSHDYAKAPGVEQLLCGTPSIISMSILDAALDVFDAVSIEQIRIKSIALNHFFQTCVDTLYVEDKNHPDSLTLACNADAQLRGSQISYQHPKAYEICQALIKQGVVADFRAPDVLRIGFSPLFLSFVEMHTAATILVDIMSEQTYLHAQYSVRNAVT
jgi:kynureninase